jgi:ABC-type multidrug transport system fused ATPase/permease subunit
MTPSMSASQTAPVWPALPYRGLSYYGQEDEALFGGRENDVEDCAHVLSSPSTRLLMLHGRTGCGKSSFLRAGLIPYLIRADAGFEFLTEVANGVNRPMFVHCTYAPLLTLAEAVCKCTERKRPSRRPQSTKRELPMDRVLLGKPTPSDYAQFVSSNPAALVQSLEEIAAILPRTLVIVLDQAEEVLTLRPGADGDQARDNFFTFIRDFARSRFDLKMVICFRTEYYGEYDARINEDYLENPLSMRGYRLREFDHERIVKAIKLPTQRTEIPGFGVPYQRYGFSYADDLPDRIAKEIEQTVHAGALPAMQIVCQRLFELTRRRRTSEQWEITGADFDLLGGVEGQIDDYLTQALIEPCHEHKLLPIETLREIVRWRSVLHNLVRLQADGMVTTELVKEEVLATQAGRQKCKVKFESMAAHLSSEHPDYPRVLRHIASAELGSRYSLAHDVLGLTLQRWYQEQAQTIAWARRLKWAVRIVSFAVLLLFLMGVAFLISPMVNFKAAPAHVKFSIFSILTLMAVFGISGAVLASTARMTDWLSMGWFSAQAAIVRVATERRRLSIMRDRRFRVYLEVVPRAREFLESTLRMGAAKSSNYWHAYKETETAVVFVHGVFSDSMECWRKDDQSQYWPDLVRGDPGLRDAAIYLAGYYTALKTGPSDIRECSNLVFSALNRREPTLNPVMARKNLIFVCHASGSLVVRDMLERNYPAFRDKRLGLLFIGATRSTAVGRLQHYFDRNLVRELDWAKQFSEVDKRFGSLRDDNRIPNILIREALEANAPAAPADSVFRVFLDGTDHLSCVRPENREHPAHRLLLQAYQAMMDESAPEVPAGALKPPVVFLAPPYPVVQLIPRIALKEKLERQIVPGATVAISGPAGTGKSALALEIVYDPEIKLRFPGGVLWAAAGPHANVLALLGQWCAALGMASSELGALGLETDRQRWVNAAVGDRGFLIVIEDAPSAEVVRGLKVGGPNCAYLVTVRDEATAASVSDQHVSVAAFNEEESRALLYKLAPELSTREPEAVKTLVQAAAGSPTELMLIGKLAAKQGSPSAVKEIVTCLVTRQTNSEHAVINICLDSLSPKSRQMLRTLGDLPAKPNSFAQSAALAFAGGANEFDELTTAGMLELLGGGRCCIDEEISLRVCQQLVESDAEARRGLVEYYMDYVDTHWRQSRATSWLRWNWRGRADGFCSI